MSDTTRRTGLTRRGLARRAAAGATLIAAPLPLRHALAQEKFDIRVGVLLPMSGVQAQIGQVCMRGADLANDVLADMKIPVRIEVMRYDTESNADVARTQAEKAIAAGAHVLMGAFDSGHTMAVAQVAEQKSVPCVVNIAATPAAAMERISLRRSCATSRPPRCWSRARWPCRKTCSPPPARRPRPPC